MSRNWPIAHPLDNNYSTNAPGLPGMKPPVVVTVAFPTKDLTLSVGPKAVAAMFRITAPNRAPGATVLTTRLGVGLRASMDRHDHRRLLLHVAAHGNDGAMERVLGAFSAALGRWTAASDSQDSSGAAMSGSGGVDRGPIDEAADAISEPRSSWPADAFGAPS